jgi:hypothetical protein
LLLLLLQSQLLLLILEFSILPASAAHRGAELALY